MLGQMKIVFLEWKLGHVQTFHKKVLGQLWGLQYCVWAEFLVILFIYMGWGRAKGVHLGEIWLSFPHCVWIFIFLSCHYSLFPYVCWLLLKSRQYHCAFNFHFSCYLMNPAQTEEPCLHWFHRLNKFNTVKELWEIIGFHGISKWLVQPIWW